MSGPSSIPSTTEEVVETPALKRVPSDMVEGLIVAISALGWVQGECLDAVDVANRLDAGWDPRAIEKVLRVMAERGIIRSTTYWGGNPGYGPGHPIGLDPIDLDRERRRVVA
jgi:hypothetical protein